MNNRVKNYRTKIFDIKNVNRAKAWDTLPIKTVKRMENVRFIDGAFEIKDYGELLTDFNGVPITPPPSVCPKIMPIVENGQINALIAFGGSKTYINDLRGEGTWKVLIDACCTSAVNIELDNEWALLLSSMNANYTYDKKSVIKHARSSAGIYSYLISHFGRIFAGSTDRKLYFSDEIDPLNWDTGIDEGGYLGFDVNSGAIVGLESFNDYVYIFTEYTVYRLTAYAEQESFVMKKLDLDIGRIIPGSVAKCNGAIVFLTTRGLHRFDGYTAKLITDDITSDTFDPRIISACGVGQRYYLSLEKSLYVYDNENATIATLPIGFDFALSSTNNFDKALIYTNHNIIGDMGNSLYLYGSVSGRGRKTKSICVETGEFDFGKFNEQKVIKSISLSEGIIGTINISADGKQHSFNIDGRSRLPIGLHGRIFSIRFECYPFNKTLPSPIMEYAIETV